MHDADSVAPAAAATGTAAADADTAATDTPASDPAPSEKVVVYWRPGCPWCHRLFWGLKRHDIPVEAINIYEDAKAAAFVRSCNNGNETVPTVVVAGEVLTNPSPKVVAARFRTATGA